MEEQALQISGRKLQHSQIHPSAVIDPTAKIAGGVIIKPHAIIGSRVEIAAGCEIGSHAVIGDNTKMGERNRIYPFAAVGCDPQDLSYHGEQTSLEMGNDNIVREYVTLSRGSTRGSGVTRIGNKSCFLAYSHVAHDGVIGNEVLFVNNATTAGHVIIDDYVILGAFTAVHQFCRVGAYAFLSRAAEAGLDVLPYTLIHEIPGKSAGLNLVGLRRRGFSNETIRNLKRAYQIVYRRGLKLKEVEEQLIEMTKTVPEVQLMLDVIQNSRRGILRKEKKTN